MKEKIYIYPGGVLNDFIKNLFPKYEITSLNENNFKDANFKNNNILFFKTDMHQKKHQLFFSNNKPITILGKQEKNLKINNIFQLTLSGPVRIKYFIKNINAIFFSKTIFFKDIKIVDEKVINIDSGKSSILTFLEKKIIAEFVKHGKIKRDYFLENIFEISKDVETKTIESHLTRIRKKLSSINSSIQIYSKENCYYINY